MFFCLMWPPIMCFHPKELTQENQNLNIKHKFKPSKFRISRCTFNIIKLQKLKIKT